MIKLGFSTGGYEVPFSRKDRIKFFLAQNNSAIELSFIRLDYLTEPLDQEDLDNIRRFKYISLHAPVIYFDKQDPEKKLYFRYPDKNSEEIISKLLVVAETVKADTILFHPNYVDDFDWLEKKIGSRIAYENMDANQFDFKTVDQMAKVFEQSPQAKFVLDVNHVYTNDPSMKLAADLHQAFGDRLCHYHLSAYGGFHESFIVCGDDIILSGIADLSKPIIHEGNVLKGGPEALNSEIGYINARIKSQP